VPATTAVAYDTLKLNRLGQFEQISVAVKSEENLPLQLWLLRPEQMMQRQPKALRLLGLQRRQQQLQQQRQLHQPQRRKKQLV
jgi:hypothetical protein